MIPMFDMASDDADHSGCGADRWSIIVRRNVSLGFLRKRLTHDLFSGFVKACVYHNATHDMPPLVVCIITVLVYSDAGLIVERA